MRLVNRVTRRPCFSLHGSVCVVWSLDTSRRSKSPDVGNGRPPSMSCALRPAFLETHGAVPLGSNPLRKSKVYCLAPEETLVRGIPTGPESFLQIPSAFGLRSCARTHLKKAMCRTRLVGGTYNECQHGIVFYIEKV